MTDITARKTPTRRIRIGDAWCRFVSLITTPQTIYITRTKIWSIQGTLRIIRIGLTLDCYLCKSRVRRRVAESGTIVRIRTFSRRQKLNSVFENRVVIQLLTAKVAQVRTRLIVTRSVHRVGSAQMLARRGWRSNGIQIRTNSNNVWCGIRNTCRFPCVRDLHRVHPLERPLRSYML